MTKPQAEEGTFLIPNDFINEARNAKLIGVYMILASYADPETRLANPPRHVIAKAMGHSTMKATDEAIEELLDSGWIELAPVRGRTRTYRVNITKGGEGNA